jgi:hypothetical protein
VGRAPSQSAAMTGTGSQGVGQGGTTCRESAKCRNGSTRAGCLSLGGWVGTGMGVRVPRSGLEHQSAVARDCNRAEVEGECTMAMHCLDAWRGEECTFVMRRDPASCVKPGQGGQGSLPANTINSSAACGDRRACLRVCMSAGRRALYHSSAALL